MLVGIAPNPEATAGSGASAAAAAVSEPAEERGTKGNADGWQREGHGVLGQVQGPLQLSNTARAWKEALGEVDVGKWDLIYRQGPVQCPMRCLI